MLQVLWQKENTLLFLIILGLFFGNIFFYSVSAVKSLKETQSSFTYWWNFFWKTTVFGLLAFFLGFYLGYSWPKLKGLISLSFLLLTFILGLTLFLASEPKRWFSIGFFSFQPAEIMKPILLLFAGSLVVSLKEFARLVFLRLAVFWLPVSLVILLVFLQPALTNSIIILVSAFFVYLVLKLGWQDVFLVFVLFLLLAISAFFWEYRVERIVAFFEPESSSAKSFQANLAQEAISHGGFWGVGFGGSIYKIIGLPEMLTDSIIAIIGEEIGFFGLALLLLFYLTLFWYLLKMGQRIELIEGKAFAYGTVAWLSLQTFVHIAGNFGLMPLTGVVLPFFSHGGTAQVAILFAFGIIKGFYEKWA